MFSSPYRWPGVFASVALIAAVLGFFAPSLIAASIFGAIAVVFFALTMLSFPTAVQQDATSKPEDQTMQTTMGTSE